MTGFEIHGLMRLLDAGGLLMERVGRSSSVGHDGGQREREKAVMRKEEVAVER